MNKIEPGCLAFVTRCPVFPDGVGKIVTCVEMKPHKGRRAWVVSSPICKDRRVDGELRLGNWIVESSLRPIRDQPGADETLTWAGKPQSIPKETV